MSGVHHVGSTTARLGEAWRAAPPHLKPILFAVQSHGVGMLIVPQGLDSFRRPRGDKRPAIIFVADDLYCSMGPDGFHAGSLRRAIRDCAAFAVVACEPVVAAYAGVAGIAASGRHVMIVETRPEHEISWVQLIQKLAPGRPLILATVKGGRA